MNKPVVVKKNVSIIPPKPEFDRSIKEELRRLRVAAYCRVSTTMESQEGSYEIQIAYYTEKIMSNPNWELAGIFADDGKSATNTKKRDDFNSMISKCLKGKIDLIITKSVSRFARNTVDCLQTIRKLKEKNIGVFFEKEGINTLDGVGEVLLTILSSLAQEESRNLSENTRWGVVRRFEKGIVTVNHNKFMGYTKDKSGQLLIVPEEAEIVRKIFRLYLEGSSITRIARTLEHEKVMTVTGKAVWSDGVIYKMLQNEKYMGDALLQKTYTVDYLTKKRVKNDGIVPQYYVEGSHEAIIPKELFFKTQEEMARRASLHRPSVVRKAENQKVKFSSKYALTDIMVCGECGHPYRRQLWSKYGKQTGVWRCDNRLKNGTKQCKHSPTLKEGALQAAIMTAINSVVDNRNDFVGAFRENVIRVLGSYSEHVRTELDEQLEQLQDEMLELIASGGKAGTSYDDFNGRYQAIAKQIDEIKQKQLEEAEERRLAASYGQRMEQMDKCLKQTACSVNGYDEELVRKLLEHVKVINQDKIDIQFKSGIVMGQRISMCE